MWNGIFFDKYQDNKVSMRQIIIFIVCRFIKEMILRVCFIFLEFLIDLRMEKWVRVKI